MAETGTNDDDLSGLAPFLRTIKGVSVGILVKPGKKAGEHRISLRSDETCDVNIVASNFNGGGHKRAAGLVYSPECGLSFDEYKEKFRLHNKHIIFSSDAHYLHLIKKYSNLYNAT